MFKNVLLRSLAGATAIGSALTISLVATPAAVSSAPQVQTVACTEYPSRAATNTSVSAQPSMAPYGTAAKAMATVTSGAGTPTGRVRFVLRDSDGSFIDSWVVGLSGGSASSPLPRGLPARHTYTINGKYLPGCSPFGKSHDSGSYSVYKARTATKVNAPSIHRGDRARVNVAVSSSTLTPTGRVRIRIVRNGNVIASSTLTLDSGRAFASFGKYRPGLYTAKVGYLGTGNFRQSSGSDDFRIYRR
ncbi:MAG TPA: hypothetical protein VF165_19975 [Nocardioidaceae bacterium]